MNPLTEKIDTARALFEGATGGNTVKARRSHALVFDILDDINDVLSDLVDFVFPPLTEEEAALPPFDPSLPSVQVLPEEEEETQSKTQSPSDEEDSEARVPEVSYDVEPRAKRKPKAQYGPDPRFSPGAATEEENGS